MVVIVILFVDFMVIYLCLDECLASRSMGTARQKNFIPAYIVELSKLYRMVPESWKSVLLYIYTQFSIAQTNYSSSVWSSDTTAQKLNNGMVYVIMVRHTLPTYSRPPVRS